MGRLACAILKAGITVSFAFIVMLKAQPIIFRPEDQSQGLDRAILFCSDISNIRYPNCS